MRKLLELTPLVLLPVSVAIAQPGFTALGYLPGGWTSTAHGVSGDGRWVIGESSIQTREAFRWSATTGMHSLGPYQGVNRSLAFAVSWDGQVVAGDVISPSNAFRWTPATGKEALGYLPGRTAAYARGMSRDGSVIVGWSSAPDAAFVWTQATGMLPVPLQGVTQAHAVSADGMIVVGHSDTTGIPFRWDRREPAPTSLTPPPGLFEYGVAFSISADGRFFGGTVLGNFQRAYIWSAEHGYTFLPAAPGTGHCRVLGLSNDATVAVGYCTVPGSGHAAIWTGPGPQGPYEAHRLSDYLVQQGVSMPANTTLASAEAITPDGRIIVGGGWPGGVYQAYRIEFCYANCDRSTTQPYLNIDDFTCFINKFAQATALPHAQQLYHYANCDHSTTAPVLNVDDFTCFINRFAAGCASP